MIDVLLIEFSLLVTVNCFQRGKVEVKNTLVEKKKSQAVGRTFSIWQLQIRGHGFFSTDLKTAENVDRYISSLGFLDNRKSFYILFVSFCSCKNSCGCIRGSREGKGFFNFLEASHFSAVQQELFRGTRKALKCQHYQQ